MLRICSLVSTRNFECEILTAPMFPIWNTGCLPMFRRLICSFVWPYLVISLGRYISYIKNNMDYSQIFVKGCFSLGKHSPKTCNFFAHWKCVNIPGNPQCVGRLYVLYGKIQLFVCALESQMQSAYVNWTSSFIALLQQAQSLDWYRWFLSSNTGYKPIALNCLLSDSQVFITFFIAGNCLTSNSSLSGLTLQWGTRTWWPVSKW